MTAFIIGNAILSVLVIGAVYAMAVRALHKDRHDPVLLARIEEQRELDRLAA